MTWILLRHPDGPAHLTPAGTEAPLVARGWVVEPLPEGLDPDDPNAPNALADALTEADRQSAVRKQTAKKAATPATEKKE